MSMTIAEAQRLRDLEGEVVQLTIRLDAAVMAIEVLGVEVAKGKPKRKKTPLKAVDAGIRL